MNNYLIPANSKKGQLIFNIFRWFDLILLLIGAIITVFLMFLFQGMESITMIFIKLVPLGLSILLVMPIPYYHNVLVFLQEMYLFYANRRTYAWKGWCATSEFNEQ